MSIVIKLFPLKFDLSVWTDWTTWFYEGFYYLGLSIPQKKKEMSVNTVHHCIHKCKLGLLAIHVSPASRNNKHFAGLSRSGMVDTKCPLSWRVLIILENHGYCVLQTIEEKQSSATCKRVRKPESWFLHSFFIFYTKAPTLITMWLWNGWLHVCMCVCCVTGDLLFIRYFVTWCV